ncbi:hypothetical protein AnigIFM63604_006899, partial [Aspergillus niger]
RQRRHGLPPSASDRCRSFSNNRGILCNFLLFLAFYRCRTDGSRTIDRSLHRDFSIGHSETRGLVPHTVCVEFRRCGDSRAERNTGNKRSSQTQIQLYLWTKRGESHPRKIGKEASQRPEGPACHSRKDEGAYRLSGTAGSRTFVAEAVIGSTGGIEAK